MRITGHPTSQGGTILILALWTLGFLSLFIISLAVGVRQKMMALSRLEKRSAVRDIAESGVRKALAVFISEKFSEKKPIPILQKEYWFNNPDQFQQIVLGRGYFDVKYTDHDLVQGPGRAVYGISDEERRINVNTADHFVLTRLIAAVTPLSKAEAGELARAIVSWREYGETDVIGFYSDHYYENLEYPYPPKKKDFETPDELLLVKGMTPAVYRRLLDFITIYGNGAVNINTASAPVLAALGFSPGAIQRILLLRRGPDQLEATADDYMFSLNMQGTRMNSPEKALEESDLSEISQKLGRKLIGMTSAYFRVQSTGRLEHSDEGMTITCVFEGNSGRIFYWREQRGIAASAEPGFGA